MFKFNDDAKAYLNASNDLMEEIEGRGFASVEAAKAMPQQIWEALSDEWKARQDVLDAGPTGNYDAVIHSWRTAAVITLAAGVTGLVATKVYFAYVERAEDKRREERRQVQMAQRAVRLAQRAAV